MTTLHSPPSAPTTSRDGYPAHYFAGLTTLLRLVARREWKIGLITLAVFLLINLATATSINSMYPTPEKRVSLQMGPGSNAAFRFLLGPLRDIDSAAAVTVWRAGLFLVAALAVCAALMVVRQTRKEEELGRSELVRAAATGSLASLAAAVIVAAVFCVVVALGVSLMLLPLGAGGIDVAAVFIQYVSTGLAGVGIAAVAAQIATTSHIANLTASTVVFIGYALRGVADAIHGWDWLRWVSPMGWAELIAPFNGNHVGWALLSLSVCAAGLMIAGWVVAHRDMDAGLIAPRPGPAETARLGSLPAVARRLSGPMLASWAGAIVVYASVVGFMQPSIDDLARDNQQIMSLIEMAGIDATLSELFGTTIIGFLAVAASAWAVSVATRLRGEETESRAEFVLTTPTSRASYFLTYAGVAALGVVVVLAAAAVGMVVGNGIAGGGWTTAVANTVIAAAAQIPAALVIATFAVALYGLAPRLVPAGWLIVVAAFLLGPLAGMFDLPQWVDDLSPFTHTPKVPVTPMEWTPVAVMLAIAVVFTAAGLVGFRRRDVG
ncbi:ABC transporter permease [Gordonia rhizosphera]|uniref:Putative ABC transporter permease protein n=1 Tax=Gordonia rhizosphera NBRC 16068 TaxID=1108045 RepID=K6W609_9ACTN|nr:hypothetical protein [Gordonia rhizosphera]GAB89136.1 putative ABC transporter permease protein [Gordonia rhizosphera NBRC 16068]